MNGPIRQSMIPQSTIGQQQMLSIGNPTSFMQGTGPLGAQQSLSQTSLGMPQNVPTNPPMGMLGAAPVPGGAVQRYPMQQNPMQQSLQQQQRPMIQRQAQNLNPSVPNSSANAHISQLQGLPFAPNMMQPPMGAANNIRRVHSLNNMTPLGVLPGPVTGSMSMGMNPQTGIPGQLRQVPGGPQHLHQLRLQQQQPMMPQATMSDLMMRNPAAGNPVMQPAMGARVSSAQGQVMSSLTQPASVGSAGSMQGTHPNSFSNGSMPSSQLSTSPRPNSTPGPSHASINRVRTSPDNNNSMSFLNYPASQFSSNNTGRGVLPSPSPSYPYLSSTSPTMQLSDISHQTSPPGVMTTQGGTPANKGAFFPTPAQQQLDMSVDMYNQGFAMPPPASMPTQTPSHAPNSLQQPPHTPSMPNPQQRPPPQPSPGPQQQQSHQLQLAHQLPTEANAVSQGAPSQQQRQGAQIGGVGGNPGITATPSVSQPPRGAMSAATFPAGLTAHGRIPPSQQQGQGPAVPPQPPQQQQHQQHQPLMPIAPRPPGGGAGPQAGPALPPPPPPHASASGGGQLATGGAALPGPAISTTTSPPPSGDQAGGRGRTVPSRSSTTPSNSIHDKVGKGQGLMRLLQFSGILSNENRQKHELSFWNEVIKEYFTPKALMKLTLWKDNQKNEAKPFEIGVPILPRFFLVTTQSGVRSMTLSLDAARERLQTTGHAIVECVGAVWTYRYTNGYTVTLRGPLTAHVVATLKSPPGNNKDADVTLKFDELQFDANFHDKFIALESVLGSRSIESFPVPATPMMLTAPSPSSVGVGPAALVLSAQQQLEEERRWEEPRVLIDHASIPGEPINAFGIPQATMRCLELAESVTSMAELIQFARETTHGPRDALKEFAQKLRETGALPGPPQPPPHVHAHPMNLNPQFYPQTPSGSTATLYSSVSPSTTHSVPPGSTMNSPPNTTPSVMNSPEKQPKTIPQQQHQQNQAVPSASSTSPRMSSTSTPSNTNAPLKRKQTGEASSPTMGNEQPPPKRQPRKRGRTGTGPG